MEETELNSRIAIFGARLISVIVGGLVLAIYPGWVEIWGFLKINIRLTQDAPAWAQAIVGLLAVIVALFLPMVERRRRDKDNRNQMVKSCYVFAMEACEALKNSKNKFSGANKLYPDTSLERLRNIERVGLVLAGKEIPADLLVAITRIMREISLAIQATDDVKDKSTEVIREGRYKAAKRHSNALEQLDKIRLEVKDKDLLSSEKVNEDLFDHLH